MSSKKLTFEERVALRKKEKAMNFEPEIDTTVVNEELEQVSNKQDSKTDNVRLQVDADKPINLDNKSQADDNANPRLQLRNTPEETADHETTGDGRQMSHNAQPTNEDKAGSTASGYKELKDKSTDYNFKSKTSSSEKTKKKTSRSKRKSGFTNAYKNDIGIETDYSEYDYDKDGDNAKEEVEEDKLEKTIGFIRSTAGKLTIVGVAILFLITYLLGFFVRFKKTGHFTVNPFKNIYSAFTTKSFPSFFLFASLVTSIICICLFVIEKRGIKGNKERNFSIDGELGTATMMTQREQRLLIERVKHFEDVSSFCFGKDPKTKEFVGRKEPSGLNKNIAIFGSQGSSKSEGFARNNIEIQSRKGVSMIITDPKGELYLDTAKMLRQRGYTVKVWNLINLLSSDSCNLLKAINVADLDQLVEAIIVNTEDKAKKGDDFFKKIETMALRALILYVIDHDTVADEDRTLARVIDLLTTKTADELDAMFAKIPPTSDAARNWHLLRNNKMNQPNALLGLGARLQDLQNETAMNLVSKDDIDLELPGKEKCAYFIIRKAQNDSYKFLSSLMLTLLFIRLSALAERKASKKLDVEVMFILDEFIHMGVIPNFKNILGTVRSYGMGICMFFQNLPQMLDTFGENLAVEILGGCHTTLLLGCSDYETASYFSDLSGMATIKTEQIRKSLSTIRVTNYTPDFQRSENVTQANVLNPDEILNLNTEGGGRGLALLFINGSRPLKLEKSFAFEDNPTLRGDKRDALKELDTEHVPIWIEEKLRETHWEREDIEERGGIYKLFKANLSDVPEGYDVKLDKWREEGLKNSDKGLDKSKEKASLYAKNKIMELVEELSMQNEEQAIDLLEKLNSRKLHGEKQTTNNNTHFQNKKKSKPEKPEDSESKPKVANEEKKQVSNKTDSKTNNARLQVKPSQDTPVHATGDPVKPQPKKPASKNNDKSLSDTRKNNDKSSSNTGSNTGSEPQVKPANESSEAGKKTINFNVAPKDARSKAKEKSNVTSLSSLISQVAKEKEEKNGPKR